MPVLVQKYGGTSVATPERIQAVAGQVVGARREGWEVVVVVSAMGDATDDLLALAAEVVGGAERVRHHPRELDMLLTAGERISMALLAMAVREAGEEALSLTGSQAAIITDETHTAARITEIRADRVREALGEGQVVIVAGFQGVSRAREVTTLGRGGSDTTAVALAAALGAERCQIFTDVDGVYTADPRRVPPARLIGEISYAEMIELASSGAQVMHPRAVEIAARWGVEIEVLSSFAMPPPSGAEILGTRITRTPERMEELALTGITSRAGYAKLILRDLPRGMHTPTEILTRLAEAGVSVDMISEAEETDGRTQLQLTVAEDALPEARRLAGAVTAGLGGAGSGCPHRAHAARAGRQRDDRPAGGVRPRLPRVVRGGNRGASGFHLRDLDHPVGPFGAGGRGTRCSPLRLRARASRGNGPFRWHIHRILGREVKGMHVAVLGATGAVGRTMLRVLAEREFPIERLTLLASPRSAGQPIEWGGRRWMVRAPEPGCFRGVDIALFSAGADRSLEWAPRAAEQGAVVVDNSSGWRMDPEVPLVVPEVNAAALAERPRGIIANPNCSTIQMVVALKPLHDAAGLRRVVATTLQSCSGAGQRGRDALSCELCGDEQSGSAFARPIAGNALPQIGDFDAAGWTGEERKMRDESRKILGLPELVLAATCIRVPVDVGHSVQLMVETDRALGIERAREVLDSFPGIRVATRAEEFPTPREVAGRDEVFVGRLRIDPDDSRVLHLWVVADNLRKGAATNAVQIAERLVSG